MKRRIILFLIALLPLAAPPQGKPPVDVENYLSTLPTVALQENAPQRYVFSCTYFSFDLTGSLTGKERVSGEYTRALPDGSARWNHVEIARALHLDDTFPPGEAQNYMEGFSYRPGTADQFKESFFAGFPKGMQTKTMVWDVSMFEQFAWKYFDRLKLNEPYQIQPSDISLPGGAFHNRRPVLTWVGISKMNNKLCAVIQYEVFFNKLSLSVEGQDLQGRSDYWGSIWVSLTDKQIENGTLNEGVLLGIEIPGQSEKHPMSIFRQAAFQRKR
jgi:hypothetical protein